MTDSADQGENGYGRLIREAKEEAFHARRRLRREQPTPSQGTKQEVAVALADYHDVLLDYADERALDVAWDERLPVDPDALLGETVTVEQSVPARNRAAAETVDVPAAATLAAHQLLSLAKELDAIAKELGFAASAKKPTPGEEASMGDLRGLLKSRGQDQALEFLPEGDDEQEAVTDGGSE